MDVLVFHVGFLVASVVIVSVTTVLVFAVAVGLFPVLVMAVMVMVMIVVATLVLSASAVFLVAPVLLARGRPQVEVIFQDVAVCTPWR